MNDTIDKPLPPSEPAWETFAPTFIQIAQRLTFQTCPECGLSFAVPAEWHLSRLAAKGGIHCPAGHVIQLKKAGLPDKINALAVSAELLVKLREAEHEVERLRGAMARVPRLAAMPLSEEELVKRMRFVINRAAHDAYGKFICRYCERVYARSSFKTHLRKDHLELIRDLPIEFFDG